MESITTTIISVTALIAALGTLIATVIKAKKEIENTLPRKIQKQCSIDMEITDKMEALKEFVQADRVQIYDFHNGGHYANGRSALKTSCTFEVVRAGIKSHQKELQAVPLSCIPSFIRTLLNKQQIKISNLEDIKMSMPATYGLKKEQEIGSFFDIILNNKNGDPIGFLALQFSKTDCVNFSNNEMNEILKLKFFIEENLEKMVSKK